MPTKLAASKRLGAADDRYQVLLRKAVRWASDNESAAAGNPLTPSLNDRATDNWRPLLAIAETLGGAWPAMARAAATALSGMDEVDDGSPATLLLADLFELFDRERSEVLTTRAILEALNDREDRPWPEWGGKPLSAHGLSKLLRQFGIRPHTVRFGGDTAKGYKREQSPSLGSATSYPINRHNPLPKRVCAICHPSHGRRMCRIRNRRIPHYASFVTVCRIRATGKGGSGAPSPLFEAPATAAEETEVERVLRKVEAWDTPA